MRDAGRRPAFGPHRGDLPPSMPRELAGQPPADGVPSPCRCQSCILVHVRRCVWSLPVGWFGNSTLHSDYAPVTNLSVTCIQATAGVIHPRSPSAWSSYVTAGIGGGGGRAGRLPPRLPSCIAASSSSATSAIAARGANAGSVAPGANVTFHWPTSLDVHRDTRIVVALS